MFFEHVTRNFVLLYVVRRIITIIIFIIINIIIIIITINIINITNKIIIFLLCKSVWSLVYIVVFCVGAGISTLMSIFDGLGSYFFGWKMERTQPMSEEVDRTLFIPRQRILCLFS